MQDILRAAEELAAAIRSSETVQSYNTCSQNVKRDPQLYNMLLTYKRELADFHVQEMNNDQDMFNRERFIGKLYADCMLQEDLRKLLEDERILADMINKVLATLTDALPELQWDH